MKAFQLAKPTLKFDVIVVDEFQDWNAAYIDVVESQDAELILAGDRAQAIYGWNGADGNKFTRAYEINVLDGSWRCPEEICEYANGVLALLGGKIQMHSNLDKKASVELADWETHVLNARRDITVLTRNNALAYTYANKLVKMSKNILVQVGLESDGIKNHWLWLRKQKTGTYLDKFKSEADLQRFYQSCFMVSKSSMLSCAKKIDDWYELERRMKEFDPFEPSVLITNVFQAKGLEWDNVYVAEDFKEIEDMHTVVSDADLAEIYVAMTRAKKALYLPDHLFKKSFEIHRSSKYLDSSMFASVYQRNTAIIDELQKIQAGKSKTGLLVQKRGAMYVRDR
jgi:superfamily I DNA/RNA helicase